MELQEPIKQREVIDFSFIFTSGNKLEVTIDPKDGDTVVEQTDRYVLNITAKPNAIDPDASTDAETLEIFKNGLAAVSKCPRLQREPTEEELFEMRATLHNLAKGIQ